MTVLMRDDFDPGKIADCGQCFRAVPDGDGRCVFITGDRLVRLTPLGEGRYEAECSPADWDGLWRRYFDLDRSYAALRAAIPPEDRFLRAAAEEGTGIRVLRQDPWETLISFILSQRKSIPAIRWSVEALCDRWGERRETSWGTAVRLFPSPAALAAAEDGALAACGLGYRLPYVRDAAAQVAGGGLDLAALDALGDEALHRRLKEVRGVGDKVADCVALFAYGRVDCAPVDVWIARIIREEYGGQNPFPRYGGGAGILQQYMFCHARVHNRRRV